MNEKKIVVQETSVDELKSIFREIVREELAKARSVDNTDEKDRLLSRREVMNLLDISEPTLYRRIHDGELSMYKSGRRAYFKEAEVLESLRKVKMPNPDVSKN